MPKTKGSPKTGGRKPGVPNKITALARTLIARWLEMHNSKQNPDDATELIWQDFLELEPKERVKVSVEFIKIIMPKTVNVDESGDSRHLIISRLSDLAKEEEDSV